MIQDFQFGLGALRIRIHKKMSPKKKLQFKKLTKSRDNFFFLGGEGEFFITHFNLKILFARV